MAWRVLIGKDEHTGIVAAYLVHCKVAISICNVMRLWE